MKWVTVTLDRQASLTDGDDDGGDGSTGMACSDGDATSDRVLSRYCCCCVAQCSGAAGDGVGWAVKVSCLAGGGADDAPHKTMAATRNCLGCTETTVLIVARSEPGGKELNRSQLNTGVDTLGMASSWGGMRSTCAS